MTGTVLVGLLLSSPAHSADIYINGVLQAETQVETAGGTFRSDAGFSGRIGNVASGTDRSFDGTIALFKTST